MTDRPPSDRFSPRNGPNAAPVDVEIDINVAHVARVYDYLLGGQDNFAVDRAAAEAVTAPAGGIEKSRRYVRANRRFLRRAVRYLAGEAGIRQFLDIGTGIPNQDNVHGVAQETAPDSRIVYVDNDPVVLAHAHTLLKSTPEGATAYFDGDVRDPEPILSQAADTLDFSQPVAVMLVSMMHLFRDSENPWAMVPPFTDAVSSGSYLVLSHLAGESQDMTKLGEAVEVHPTTNYTLTPRSHSQVARFFDGLDLVEPGLVLVDDWRPDEPPGDDETPFHGGVARRP